MSAQNETTNTAGEATTTVDKGKGKATEPATDDVSMGEDEDSSEEESGAEEPVSEAHQPHLNLKWNDEANCCPGR